MGVGQSFCRDRLLLHRQETHTEGGLGRSGVASANAIVSEGASPKQELERDGYSSCPEVCRERWELGHVKESDEAFVGNKEKCVLVGQQGAWVAEALRLLGGVVVVEPRALLLLDEKLRVTRLRLVSSI